MKLSKQIEKIFKTSWYPMIEGRSNFNAPKAEKQILSAIREYIAKDIVGKEEEIDQPTKGKCSSCWVIEGNYHKPDCFLLPKYINNGLRKQQLTKLDKDFKEMLLALRILDKYRKGL